MYINFINKTNSNIHTNCDKYLALFNNFIFAINSIYLSVIVVTICSSSKRVYQTFQLYFVEFNLKSLSR